ncbi:MAG: DNA polymerase III subunit gamma/tau [Clostridiales bacterium]|nr:DNA polymerase III subunit gamma/tau [Clostridiales bacterium]
MYQALYRKWRPRAFTDVSGQPHVTQTLMHEVSTGKISHAYLFTGSRGTGKTTCAKILSKAVNCLSPENGNPCNKCEICRGIDSGSILDVTEIDAASNNGVDNIRDLRDEAVFTPVKAKYRVYIIDEVHMLSTGAFNALLKILEEPPSYVIFILATTEVHKLPPTILSRCQRFDFKHIPPEDISDRLRYVASKENITVDDEALSLIARISDGALRDALSLFDRCSALDKNITADTVSACAGTASREYLFDMAVHVKNKDAASALGLLNELNKNSCGMEQLCVELIDHFRNLMISKIVKNPENLIICSTNELKLLKEQSSLFTLEQLLSYISILETASLNLKKGLDKRIEAETAVIKLCTPSLNTDIASVLARISEVEKKILSGSFSAPETEKVKPVSNIPKETEKPAAEKISEEKRETIEETAPADTSAEIPETKAKPDKTGSDAEAEKPKRELFKLWPEILMDIKSTCKPVYGFLINSTAYLEDNKIYIKAENPVFRNIFDIPNYSAAIEKSIRGITGKDYKPALYEEENKSRPNDPLFDLVKQIDSLKNK